MDEWCVIPLPSTAWWPQGAGGCRKTISSKMLQNYSHINSELFWENGWQGYSETLLHQTRPICTYLESPFSNFFFVCLEALKPTLGSMSQDGFAVYDPLLPFPTIDLSTLLDCRQWPGQVLGKWPEHAPVTLQLALRHAMSKSAVQKCAEEPNRR